MSNNESRDTCIYFMFKLATALKNRPVDRHHRWRIRLASGSKQAARATPGARSACFVPRSAKQKNTSVNFHCKSDRGVYVPLFPDKPRACSGRCGTQESVQITVSHSRWPFRAPMQEMPNELAYRDLPMQGQKSTPHTLILLVVK